MRTVNCVECVHAKLRGQDGSVFCEDPNFYDWMPPSLVSSGDCEDFQPSHRSLLPPVLGEQASSEGHGADDLAAGTKDSNPKDAIGSTKLPLHLVPSLTTAYASLGHLNGCLKYGKVNWRRCGVRASIYGDAAMRHLGAWLEGEEDDPDDGVPHLAAVLACVGIILDARAAGMLTDDRCLPNEGYRAEIAKLTAHVKRLQELHAGKTPRHFTIADKEG